MSPCGTRGCGPSLSPDSGQRTAVLFDRFPLWLAAVEQVLTRTGVAVLGKATSPNRAIALLERHQPDIFVAEIETPEGTLDGITMLNLAHERVPQLKVIVLAREGDPHRIDQALEAGAAAYVIKTAQPEDLAAAIRQAFEHSVYFAGRRAAAPAANGELAETVTAEDGPKLTRRELEILRLVGEGHSNAELAQMLWVTEQTVKFHLSNVYRKLKVSNRTEASRWAQVRGLLTSTGPARTAAETPAAPTLKD